MNFPPTDALEQHGRNIVFLVKMPDVKPSALIDEVVFIGETSYRCIGLEAYGPARPGNPVRLVVRPLPNPKDTAQGQLF